MKDDYFSNRVKRCIEVGDMTVGDLKHWFNRPYPTIWRWVNSGYSPRGPAGRKAFERLDLLERAIDKGIGFPIPTELTCRERPKYIMQCRRDAQDQM